MTFELLDPIDFAFLSFTQSLESPLLTLFFQIITFLGNPAVWIAVAAIMYWKGRENESFFFMNVLLFSIVVVGILKTIIARPRPDPQIFRVLSNDFYSSNSFPSGHASTIAAYYSFLKGKINRNSKMFFLLLVLLVMLSRVYLGAHFLSDVIAGAVIGYVIGFAAKLFSKEIQQHHFRLSKLQDELFFAITVLLALAVLVFVAQLLLIAIFLGFYAGFFLSKEIGLKAKKIAGKKMFVKQAIGLLVLAVLSAPFFFEIIVLGIQTIFVLMFLAGFWISFLWPFLHSRFFE